MLLRVWGIFERLVRRALEGMRTRPGAPRVKRLRDLRIVVVFILIAVLLCATLYFTIYLTMFAPNVDTQDVELIIVLSILVSLFIAKYAHVLARAMNLLVHSIMVPTQYFLPMILLTSPILYYLVQNNERRLVAPTIFLVYVLSMIYAYVSRDGDQYYREFIELLTEDIKRSPKILRAILIITASTILTLLIAILLGLAYIVTYIMFGILCTIALLIVILLVLTVLPKVPKLTLGLRNVYKAIDIFMQSFGLFTYVVVSFWFTSTINSIIPIIITGGSGSATDSKDILSELMSVGISLLVLLWIVCDRLYYRLYGRGARGGAT